MESAHAIFTIKSLIYSSLSSIKWIISKSALANFQEDPENLWFVFVFFFKSRYHWITQIYIFVWTRLNAITVCFINATTHLWHISTDWNVICSTHTFCCYWKHFLDSIVARIPNCTEQKREKVLAISNNGNSNRCKGILRRSIRQESGQVHYRYTFQSWLVIKSFHSIQTNGFFPDRII